MKLLSRTMPNDHNYFLFSCKHTGSQLSSQKGWEELINCMHSEYDGCKNNYGADSGDMIEAITIDDKRYSPDKLSEPLPLEQANDAVKEREPIKHILTHVLEGNHERSLWKFGNLAKMIADDLGVPYGTYTTKMTILDEDGKLMYKLFHTHGRKMISSTADDPIRRNTNLRLILKRHLKYKAGDCAVMVKAHVHRLLVCRPENELYLVDDGESIKQKYTAWKQNLGFIHPDARWYGCAGSFLKLYGDGISGYAEVGEYDPVELGFLVLKVRDKRIVDLVPHYIKV